MRRLIAALVAVAVLGLLGYAGFRGYRYLYERITPQRCSVVMDGGVTTLSPEQARNASIIVAVSFEKGLPEQAAVIALATAYQESGLRNLDYGDRDSLGLFQQRPSYGWGTEEQILDPWYSSAAFYDELVTFDGWETGDVNDVAQQVQRSGHPDAYRQHEEKAVAVAGALRGSTSAALGCLSFDDAAADPAQFERQLAALGVTVTLGDDAATLTSDDPAALWAAVHMAVANSYEGGVTGAVVEDRAWSNDDDAWGEADEAAAPGTAELRFG